MLDKLQWNNITAEQKTDIISKLNTTFTGLNFSAQTASLKSAELSFYKDILLLEIDDPFNSSAQAHSWYLYHENLQVYLDGSSDPIHSMNEFTKIALTEKSVVDYVHFFGFFVNGEDGPFFIIEDSNFPAIDRKKMDFLALKSIKDSCKTLKLVKISYNGFFELEGTVLYGNALFAVVFAVTPNGLIEMIDDEPLVAEIPVIKIKPNY